MDDQVKDKLNKEYFPMFKVVFEDSYRFRDIENSWQLDDEPVDLLRTKKTAEIYIMEQVGDEWKLLYDRLSYDMVIASLEIKKIKDMYSIWKNQYVDNPPVMFIYENAVFKDIFVMFDQFAIAGAPIEPKRYYAYEDRIKVDFFKTYVRPIPKDTILIHNEQVYYNGALIYSQDHLMTNGIKSYSTSEILKFLKETNTFPEKTEYISDWEMGKL